MQREEYDVDIRPAAPADASRIASVMRESFVEYESLYTPAGFSATTPTADQVRRRMVEGPVWVASHEGVIVGTVSAVTKGDAVYVRGMAVLPSSRGRKIGEALLKQVEDFASRRGYARLFLSTTPFLSRAIRLYERCGFRRSGEGPHELFGTPLFTMVKSLEPAD